MQMRALIIGHTGGIGSAVASALGKRGVDVVGVSRSTHGLDLRNPESIEAVFAAVSGQFDLVIVATGQLDGAGRKPEKSLKALTYDAMADQFAVNTIGPALILRQLPRLLPKDRPCTVAVLSARVGSIGDNKMGGWYSYRAAKAATNQVVHSAAIELSRSHKLSCIIAYHPGTVATPFTAQHQGNNKTVGAQDAAHNMLAVLDGMTPSDTGNFFDWRGAPVVW
nr:SDR family NAD(P)-dependent oxidoreductase [Pacificibacter marinus]